jgi:hypothetical protein
MEHTNIYVYIIIDLSIKCSIKCPCGIGKETFCLCRKLFVGLYMIVLQCHLTVKNLKVKELGKNKFLRWTLYDRPAMPFNSQELESKRTR